MNSFPIDDRQARQWASFAHVLSLLGYAIGFGHVLIPLVIYLAKREDHEFIADQAKESFNFHLTMFLLQLLCVPLICVGIGIILVPLLVIVDVVLTVIAGIKASEGVRYRYPFALRLL
jgi:uncharacterized protein